MGLLLGGGLLASIIAGLCSPDIAKYESDIVKSGIVAIIISRMSKAIGEKEISEIISGCGWLIVGIDVLNIVKVVGEFIKK